MKWCIFRLLKTLYCIKFEQDCREEQKSKKMVLNEFSHQKCTEANSYQHTISLLRPRKPHMVPTHLPATSQLDEGPFLYYVSTGRGGGGQKMVIFAHYPYINHAYIVDGWVRKCPQTCICNIWMIPNCLWNFHQF